jgi:hypothetical protein
VALARPSAPWRAPSVGRIDATVPRNIATASLAGMRNRLGESFIEHVERVAATVPAEARAVARLHDVLEHSETPVEELRSAGLTPGRSPCRHPHA